MRTRKLPSITGQEASAKTWFFDFSPLHHWLWWLALAVLLVNDNLLKGRGLAPGWLTGKLSDIAFLVVAPVLLTTLLPLRLLGRRLLAFAAVVAVYAAADLSASASDAIVALAARFGLHWRLWPDFTDLLALAVLPAGWWIAGTRGRQPLRSAKTVVQTAGLAIGVFACLATSEDLGYEHYPFFLNRTAGPRDISLMWLLRKTDCSLDVASLAASLTSSDLDDAHAVTLASGQVAPLDAAPTSPDTMAGVCGNLTNRRQYQGQCMAVIVSAKDGPAVLVSAKRYWHEGGGGIVACSGSDGSPSQCAPLMSVSKDPGPDALSLVESGGQLKFQAGSNLATASIDMVELANRVPVSSGCRELRTQIHALLVGATACAADADCQVLRVNLAIPGGGICNVDVNLSVSSEQIDQQKAAWIAACDTDDSFTCYGAHPPLCNAGKCGELCAGLAVPFCPPTCASLGYAISLPCSPATTSSCLSSDEQLCTCDETRPTSNTYALRCKPQAEVPGCPVRCLPTQAVIDASAVEVAPDSQLDSRRSGAQLDSID